MLMGKTQKERERGREREISISGIPSAGPFSREARSVEWSGRCNRKHQSLAGFCNAVDSFKASEGLVHLSPKHNIRTSNVAEKRDRKSR